RHRGIARSSGHDRLAHPAGCGRHSGDPLHHCAAGLARESALAGGKGKLAEAAVVLTSLTGIPVSAARMETAAETSTVSPASATNKTSTLRTLFNQRYRTRTLLVSLPWLMMDVGDLRRWPVHACHSRRLAFRILRRRYGGGRVSRCGRQRIDRPF